MIKEKYFDIGIFVILVVTILALRIEQIKNRELEQMNLEQRVEIQLLKSEQKQVNMLLEGVYYQEEAK